MQKMEKQENQILYDWVSITSRIHSVQGIIDLLGLNREGVNWEQTTGMHGYRDRLYWLSISIHYNGREDMGVWLEMTGQGCRAFESFGSGNYEALFNEVRLEPEDVHLTRLDIAFDDHSGLLDIDTVERDAREMSFVSRFKKLELDWEYDMAKSVRGLSIYHGRKASDVMIRIYDKAAERGYTDGRHWVRVELVLKDDRCMAFLGAPGSIGERYAGVVMNYVRYIDEPDGYDSNRWRWPVKDYWGRFLDCAKAIRLYRKPGIEYNRHKLQDFVYQQAGNAIAAEIICCGSLEAFGEKVRRDVMQLPLKYRDVIQSQVAAAKILKEGELHGNQEYTEVRPHDAQDLQGH